ncbi:MULTISPECIES: DoxX family protein [Streptomyces]|uniref:DoxX family protein n=1 Tax=Streptomyces ardesiacus TaxID=285564 RepID=A0ABW8H626_9ACTN|nr:MULTISPECIES: DoxX family protein [unclassified Streptomyces]KOT95887.1 membrane protein [Streptomyces sp. NRRL F-4711]
MSDTTASPTPTAAARGRGLRTALRVVQVLLAVFFAVASALPKLVAHSSASGTFAEMGWGDAGMYAIGVLELAGAVALLVPVLQSVAATALSALMVGAFVVQLTCFGGENAATPLILMVPLLAVARARRGHNEELRRLVRARGRRG